MKRIFIWILLLVCIFAFAACRISPPVETKPTEPSAPTQPTAPTAPTEQTKPTTTTKPTAPPTEPPTVPTEPPTQPTEPPHSDLYIEGVSVEDVIRYFNEVCLDAEFSSGGDPQKIQKWGAPIKYILDGAYTQEDAAKLNQFAAWLNTIEGFPGMSETKLWAEANMKIYFRNQSGLVALMGNNFAGCDGGVTFWYRNDIIYDATVCYRTDIDQYLRNSVILEEIYNGLGPVQDTSLRKDSIIYSGFSQPQWLTAVDELIVKLLYHPDIKCGMDAAACESVIRSLYY